MKIKYIYALTVLISLVVFSCETTEKIDEFPLRPSRLVLNSYFSADSIWAVQVSKSLSVLDNADLEYVGNATIKLYKNSVFIDTIKETDGNGWYYSFKNLPETGQSYTLEVSIPDYKTPIIAEDYVPSAVPLSNVEIGIIDSSFYTESYYDDYYDSIFTYTYGNLQGTFEIAIDDPGNKDNFYEISVYSYVSYPDYNDPSIIYVDKRIINFSTEDPVADENDSYLENIQFSDEIFNGQKYILKLDFQDWDAKKDKEYIIELTSLSEAGYLYKKSVKEYLNAYNDPFAEPVLIYDNIENGYGIFAGYSVRTFGVKLIV